ncbi:MAG: TIGR04255 family protein [Cyanobacteriota bacterium]|nr:TIGR04255 family protein [Cyanobacteriota bacterium]
MKVGADTEKLPSYELPPVTEVAFSVLFKPIQGLLSPHIGILWQGFQPDYPFCDDAVPITPKIEFFGDQGAEPKIELSNIPPLPRVWFISKDGTRLVRIQRDRFIHNWRKIRSDDYYPKYDSLIEAFENYLSRFESLLQEAELGEVQPIQYELTYVNQISQGQAWSSPEDIGRVFPDLEWKVKAKSFLDSPQNISWATVFELPEKLGRLHTSVNLASINESPTFVFRLTVRGIGTETSKAGLKDWFDMAHEWLVFAFADLTSTEIKREVWKQRV